MSVAEHAPVSESNTAGAIQLVPGLMIPAGGVTVAVLLTVLWAKAGADARTTSTARTRPMACPLPVSNGNDLAYTRQSPARVPADSDPSRAQAEGVQAPAEDWMRGHPITWSSNMQSLGRWESNRDWARVPAPVFYEFATCIAKKASRTSFSYRALDHRITGISPNRECDNRRTRRFQPVCVTNCPRHFGIRAVNRPRHVHGVGAHAVRARPGARVTIGRGMVGRDGFEPSTN